MNSGLVNGFSFSYSLLEVAIMNSFHQQYLSPASHQSISGARSYASPNVQGARHVLAPAAAAPATPTMVGQPINTFGTPGGYSTMPSYLPNFLLGSPAVVSSSPPMNLSNYGHSPYGTTSNKSPLDSPMQQETSPVKNYRCFSDSYSRKSPALETHYGNNSPPVESMYDDPNPPVSSRAGAVSGISVPTEVSYLLGNPTADKHPGFSQVFSQTQTVQTPNQVDPFHHHGDQLKSSEDLDGTWITVFGFTPAMASSVLQEFSTYGVVERHVASADKNWMHVKYQTKLQARRALGKNGKIVCGSVMIGVTACIDKSVMGAVHDGVCPGVAEESSSWLSGTPVGTRDRPSTLRQLNSPHFASQESTRTTINEPRRQTGFAARVSEFMFGW